MTGLLVSVRDGVEAAAAVAGGADVIDVKEPRAGSLGAAEAATWQAVHDVVRGRHPLSVALGELADRDIDARVEALSRLAEPPRFAKFGLARCAGNARWAARWCELCERLPPGTGPVAVVYADAARAAAPPPQEIIRLAIERRVAAVLIDTCCKDAGGLFDRLPAERVKRLLEPAREARLCTVIAGSLDASSLPRAVALEPDYVAVRGAACRSGCRIARVDANRVRRLAGQVRGAGVAAGKS